MKDIPHRRLAAWNNRDKSEGGAFTIMLPFIADRIHDFSADSFINDLFEASKLLGALEAKIDG